MTTLDNFSDHWAGASAPAPAPAPAPAAPKSGAREAVRGAPTEVEVEGEWREVVERPSEPFADEIQGDGDDVLKSVAKAGAVGAVAGGLFYVVPKVLPKLVKLIRRLF